MCELTDQEWVWDLKQKKPEVIACLWEKLVTWGATLAWRYRQDEDLARDVAILVYTQICERGVYQYRFQGPFPGYCRRIYVNQFLEEVRRRAKAASIVDGRDLDLVQEVLGVEADFNLGEMPAPLELCLKALSAFERLVVQLLYVYELSPQEAADRLQRRRGYINVTAHRARRSLLLCLQGKGFKSADELLAL